MHPRCTGFIRLEADAAWKAANAWTATAGAAMGAVNALTADGLFIGQTQEFFMTLQSLATKADAAQRGV